MRQSHEEVIRAELRSLADSYVKIWQTAVAVFPASMLALFYLRRDLAERLISAKKLAQSEALPWDIYLLGTLFLLVMSVVFIGISHLIGNRYKYYDELLRSVTSIHPPSRWAAACSSFFI